MLLPLRCEIMRILIKNPEGLEPEEIYAKVDPKYKKERQCSVKAMDGHLMSMKGVGIVEAKSARSDASGTIILKYAFTEYGLETAKKYFPALLAAN